MSLTSPNAAPLALAKINSDRYEERARYQYEQISYSAWTAPVLSHKRLYVRDEDSLLCLLTPLLTWAESAKPRSSGVSSRSPGLDAAITTRSQVLTDVHLRCTLSVMHIIALANLSSAEGAALQEVAPSSTMDWNRVFEIRFDDGGLVATLGPALLIAIACILVLALAWSLWLREYLLHSFEVVEAELEIANLGKVTIRPNRQNSQIAHEAWAELVTRKAAVPFDERYDVIAEVYDSYYHLFSRLRDLTKRVPAYKLRHCQETRSAADPPFLRAR